MALKKEMGQNSGSLAKYFIPEIKVLIFRVLSARAAVLSHELQDVN